MSAFRGGGKLLSESDLRIDGVDSLKPTWALKGAVRARTLAVLYSFVCASAGDELWSVFSFLF